MTDTAPGSKAVATGELVVLRHPVEADRAEFIEVRRGSRAYLEAWEPIPPRGFDAFGHDAFNRDLALASTPTTERLLVCRREDGRIVGKVSMSDIVRGPAQFCHVGYWMSQASAGRGYMTEAIALALEYAFTTLGLHRVEANIQPHNEASRRVVQKCGFRLEGLSPRYLKIQGVWADHERWAITVEEWRERRRAGG